MKYLLLLLPSILLTNCSKEIDANIKIEARCENCTIEYTIGSENNIISSNRWLKLDTTFTIVKNTHVKVVLSRNKTWNGQLGLTIVKNNEKLYGLLVPNGWEPQTEKIQFDEYINVKK